VPDSTELFCVRSTAERAGWQPFLPVPAELAVDAAALVLDAPEFLSTTVSRYRAAMPAEIPALAPGRVLVAVADDGRIALVACPQEDGPDAWTALVADVLTAAGRLWRRPYESLATEFQQHLGVGLEERLVGLSEPALRAGLEQRLKQGRFPVFVLVSSLSPEASEAIALLRSMNIEVKVLGFETYKSGAVDAVVPTTQVKAAAQPAAGSNRPAPAQDKRPPAQEQQKKGQADRKWFKR